MKIEFEIGKKTYGLKELLLLITCICILLTAWQYSSYCDKFAYEEQVNIVGGFYRGQTGEIRQRGWFRKYQVAINSSDYSKDHEWIKSDHLEPVFKAEAEIED